MQHPSLTDRNSMLQFNLVASCLLAADQKLRKAELQQ